MTAQSEKTYEFTASQVKEIAVELGHKRLLELDTADLNLKINLLETQKRLLEGKVSNLTHRSDISDSYVQVLENDVEVLKEDNNALERRNRVLKLKLKVSNYIVPIALTGGVVLGILIAK